MKQENRTKKSLSEAQLYTLLDSMKIINSTLDLDRLLAIVMEELTDSLEADRSTLYLVDRGKNEIWSIIAQGDKKLEIRQPVGMGISGHVAKTGEIINIRDAYEDDRFNPEVDKKSGYRTRSILCVPVLNKTREVIAVLQALNKNDGYFSVEDEVFTSVFADYISLAIQNAQLYKEALERKRLENEIALAGELQKLLLPKQMPQLDHYELFAHHRPSRGVGGDYYDFFPYKDLLYVILADVSGKGIPAALLMANLQATTHSLLGRFEKNSEIVKSINEHLFSVTTPDKYATLVWGNIEINEHIFHYIAAGHIPPILFRKKGNVIIHQSLTEGGIPVGMVPQANYEEGKIRLESSDLIVVCSDGITEAHNTAGEMFEENRLISVIKENYSKNISDIGNQIIQAVRNFSENGSDQDDMTLILIRRRS